MGFFKRIRMALMGKMYRRGSTISNISGDADGFGNAEQGNTGQSDFGDSDLEDDAFIFVEDHYAGDTLVILVGAITSWWITEGMDTRLRDLASLQSVLKQAHESRKAELALVKQSLSHVTLTNRQLLTYIVTQAEEEVGVTHPDATHPPPLDQRLARVNNAIQIEKEKERSAKFQEASLRQSQRGAAAAAAAANRANDSYLSAWKDPDGDDAGDLPEAHIKLRGSSRRNPYAPRFDHFPATAKVETLQVATGETEVPKGFSFPSPSRLRPVGIRGQEQRAETVLILKHPNWDDVSLTLAERGRTKVRVLEDLSLAGVGVWLPGGRLRVEVKGELVLPEVLASAANKGYWVWDEHGVFRTLATGELSDDEGSDGEGEEVLPPGLSSVSYQAPLTIIATDPGTTFRDIARTLASAGYHPQSVTPARPLTYNVLFRPPVPTTTDLQPLCQKHHWRLKCLSIGGQAY